MDNEIKTKWVEALKSDRFKQGRTFLNNRTAGTFCCLGVLCEINEVPKKDAARQGHRVTGPIEIQVVEYGETTGSGIASAAMLTPNLCKQFGLNEIQMVELAKMNDSEIPFAKIADYIQDKL